MVVNFTQKKFKKTKWILDNNQLFKVKSNLMELDGKDSLIITVI